MTLLTSVHVSLLRGKADPQTLNWVRDLDLLYVLLLLVLHVYQLLEILLIITSALNLNIRLTLTLLIQ